MRVERGTRFYDSTDDRCFFNKIVLEGNSYNHSTGKMEQGLVIGFVQSYDSATGGFSRYCGRYDESNPSASISKIMESGVKFDDMIKVWGVALEECDNYKV